MPSNGPGRRCLNEPDAWFGDLDGAPRCAEVQRIHDELCRARGTLPIA
jgi:hypothetical protein